MTTPLILLDLLLKYGPLAVEQALKLTQLIKDGKGKTEVTPADIAELLAYGNKKGADYFVTVSPTPPAS
jgi:hypothetical protein